MRAALLRFYSRFDLYLAAALRFGISFISLYYLSRDGQMIEPLNQITVLLIIAACCSFLPKNLLLLAGAAYLVARFYLCSMENAIVGGIVLLVLLLLYFCFIPSQTYIVALTALCIGLRIPFVIPVVCALLMGPGALPGIILGAVTAGLTVYLGSGEGAGAVFSEEFFNHILELFRGLLYQRELILLLVVLTAVFLVIYLIRRLPVRYSWQIAVTAGIVVYSLLVGMCSFLPDITLSPMELARDILIGGAAGFLVRYFCFALDYKRVEYVQFEDDEYYYYVKAVPKLGTAYDDSEREKGDVEE